MDRSHITDTKVAVGVLIEGSYGIADVLSISFDSMAACLEQWDLLKLCDRWRVKAQYDAADTVRVTLHATGKPIASSTTIWHSGTSTIELCPLYHGVWTLNDADAVRFFVQGVRRRGFFVLMPAIRGELVALQPIVAYIRRRE